MQPPRRTGRRRLLNQLQHATLLLVQHPHQPAQLPHLCTVGAMHRAGLADTLQPLRRSGACAWCRRASCTARSASPALCTAGWPVCGHHTAGRRARLNSCSRPLHSWGSAWNLRSYPLPPHQFRLFADQVLQRHARRVVTDCLRCRWLGGSSRRRRVAALHVADDRLACRMRTTCWLPLPRLRSGRTHLRR